MEIRDTRYARASDGAYIAHQIVGDGTVDIVFQLDWFGNVDVIWEDPFHGTELAALARFSRVIVHDRRGTGLSSRNVPPPNLETRVSGFTERASGGDGPRPCPVDGVVRPLGEVCVDPRLSLGRSP